MSLIREILLWLTVLILVSMLLWQRYGKQVKALLEKQKAKRPWSLQPKSAEDCPACVAGVELRTVNAMPTERPTPGTPQKQGT